MSDFTEPENAIVSGSMKEDSSSSDSEEDADYALLKKLADMDIEDGPARMKYKGTGFCFNDLFAQHKCDWDPNYPESPERVLTPLARCKELGLVERCIPVELSYCPVDTLMTKHSRGHVELAESMVNMTDAERMELSTRYDAWYCNKDTYEAALGSAGSVISMTEKIISGSITNGFALVRPPGHHAQEAEFNGYCTFNNVALAAQAALDAGLDKILIVDWDVHHGQGIQQMFYDDPRVLYISIHRYEYGNFWPNLRESDYDYIGKDKGLGYNVNIPLNQTGLTNADYLAVFHQVILPLAYEFSPQLVLICCGFDAAIGDEKGEMLLTPGVYAHFTHHLMALATGRICVALEGGYCLDSLAEGCALTLRSLLQDPCPVIGDTGEPTDSMTSSILNVVKVLRPYWSCFAHYKTAGRSQQCPFNDVNSMPPVPKVVFVTPENKPEKYDLTDYPHQNEAEKTRLGLIIQNLIKETNLSSAKMKCAYVFDPDMRAHKSENHPEQPDRISAIYNRLAEYKLLQQLLVVPSRLAQKSELLWIHNEEYINELEESQTLEQKELDVFPNRQCYNSVFMNQKSVHCALLSCGSVLNLVDAILTDQTQSGVAIVRPPGHHAECSRAMGFCFFNNVAVAAKLAQEKFGIKRILILDWDIHHGNATQHQFYDDPSVLYISLHRFDGGWFFPGSQDANLDRCGEGPGLGYNVNIPWAGGRMGDAEYIMAFTQIIMPIAYQFSPELVLVSAGFDAAVGDPLGGYRVSPAAYAHMTHMLMGLANGRIALTLEGGYNLTSISESMAACVSVLLGEPCPMLGHLEASHSAAVIIGAVMEVQRDHWSCLKSKVVVPSVRQVDNQRWDKERHALQQNKTKMKKNKAKPDDLTGLNRQLAPSDTSNSEPNRHDGTGTQSITQMANLVENLSLAEGSSNGGIQHRQQDHIAKENKMNKSLTIDPKRSPNDQKQSTENNSSVVSTNVIDEKESPVDKDSNLDNGDKYGGARPKVVPAAHVASGSLEASIESDGLSAEPRNIDTPISTDTVRTKSDNQTQPSDSDKPGGSSGCGASSSPDGGSYGDGGAAGGASGGACGGSSRPNTVEEFLQMQGSQQMFAVTPLPWCPHLPEVTPIPPEGIDASKPCEACTDASENWICLTCYQVHCSRFVNEHMLYHRLETEHNLVLSFSDISVWCYACDSYIDNEVLLDAKNEAHKSKFGEPLPGRT